MQKQILIRIDKVHFRAKNSPNAHQEFVTLNTNLVNSPNQIKVGV